MIHFLNLPQWAEYLVYGLLIFAGISSAAVVLTRAGRSPYFAFVLILPYAQIIGLWALAYVLWREERRKS